MIVTWILIALFVFCFIALFAVCTSSSISNLEEIMKYTEWECPQCSEEAVCSKVDKLNEGVLLRISCPHCGYIEDILVAEIKKGRKK